MSFISTMQPASSTTKGPKPHQFRPQPQSAAGINCRETRKLHRHSTTTTSTNCISPARKPPSAAANPTQNNTKRSTTAAAVSRTIYTFNLLALILTLFTSISPLLLFLSSAHAAPLPGPARPHATAGLLELTPPPFPNSTHHSAVSNSISSPTTTLYTTSTATLTLTRTIAPSASGRARRPAPTNQPDSSNPHRPPRASPAAAAQHRKGGQVVLDAADKPRVGKEGGAGHGSEGAQVDGGARGEERPAQEKAATAPKVDLRKRGDKSEEGKGEMGVHEILKLMAGIREKRAVKAGPGSHKRKPQKRAEMPASRAQASEAPRPTQNVGVGRQVPMQMVAGRRDRRPSQMLLSNLLVQKIPGTAWGGYAAMPDGGL